MEKKKKQNNIITLPEITVTSNKDGTTTVTTNKDQLDKWKRTNNFMIPIDKTKQRLSEMRRKVSQRNGIGRQIAMHTPGIFNPLAWTTSMIGGHAIDEASKALGYNSYGNMAYKNSPVLQFIGKHTNPTAVQTVAEFFNPGYLIGAGLHMPTDKSMRIFHNNISKNSKAKLISKEFEKIKNNNPEINTESNPAHTLYVDKNGKQNPIQTQPQTQKNPLNDIIDLARQGNVEATQQLKQYGLEPGNPGVYRFVSQEEVDNILNGGKYEGRFNDGRVDVTANPNGTTAANNAFRITFKPEFDLYKPSQRVRMKNAELQDGWIMDGYGLDDVATIERRLPNGNYEPYNGQVTITPQNAASITPEQWTAAQDDAIARGDMPKITKYEYRKPKQKPSTITWGKASTIIYDNYTGSPYQNYLGKGQNLDWELFDRYVKGLKSNRFGKWIGSGTEQIVYEDASNPDQVLKIHTEIQSVSPEKLRENSLLNIRLSSRNKVPYQQQNKLFGFIKIGDKYYPVTKQQKLQNLSNKQNIYFSRDIKPRIEQMLSAKGFYPTKSGYGFTDGNILLTDFKPQNIGFDKNGNIRFFDIQSFRN